jgi:hypothetical protein
MRCCGLVCMSIASILYVTIDGSSKKVVSRMYPSCSKRAHGAPGKSLPYEIQNHVRPNFATPMLYAKNHSIFFLYNYKTIGIILCEFLGFLFINMKFI